MPETVVCAEDCPDEPALLSLPRVAKRLGVSLEKVRQWARRAEDPLPNLDCCDAAGRESRRVIAAEIDPWLLREFERTRPTARR
jgi:transposase